MSARLRDALGLLAIGVVAASPFIIIAAAFYSEGRFW